MYDVHLVALKPLKSCLEAQCWKQHNPCACKQDYEAASQRCSNPYSLAFFSDHMLSGWPMIEKGNERCPSLMPSCPGLPKVITLSGCVQFCSCQSVGLLSLRSLMFDYDSGSGMHSLLWASCVRTTHA